MTTLLQYLAALATDPAAQQAFAHDPESALASSGLSEQDRAILRTRNNGLIQATVGAQAVASMIYSTAPAPAVIYASGPAPAAPVVHVIVIPVHACAAAAPHTQVIYSAAQPAVIYAPALQPAVIYAPAPQPAVIYAPAAQPAVIYAPAPKPDDAPK